MNITIEEISACKKRLKIEVPSNRVNEVFEKVTDDFQRMARIPGFRPGKAPRGVVQKKYLKDIEDELQRSLVNDAYRDAVKSKNLRVVSYPQIEDLKYQRGLSLSFSTLVELAPEFLLPPYKGLKVKAADATVTDEDVQKSIDALLDQQAEFITPEPRPVALEDFAVISYSGVCEGKPVAEWVPQAKNLGENAQFWLWMKTDMFLPKFVDQCVGMNIGDRREITVEFPADFGQTVLAGKTATYQVELKEIKIKKLPELNDDFAQKLAQMNLEQLREEIRKNLTSQKEQQAKSRQKEEILEQLLKAVNFELPESTVKAATQDTIYNIVAENQARGVSPSLLEEKKKEIYENATNNAKESVKVNFLLGRIAEEEKIAVTQEEMAQQIQYIAYQQQMAPEKVVEALRKNNGFGQIEQRIRSQKVLDFLLENATIE